MKPIKLFYFILTIALICVLSCCKSVRKTKAVDKVKIEKVATETSEFDLYETEAKSADTYKTTMINDDWFWIMEVEPTGPVKIDPDGTFEGEASKVKITAREAVKTTVEEKVTQEDTASRIVNRKQEASTVESTDQQSKSVEVTKKNPWWFAVIFIVVIVIGFIIGKKKGWL